VNVTSRVVVAVLTVLVVNPDGACCVLSRIASVPSGDVIIA
jgi:hypothetical protein